MMSPREAERCDSDNIVLRQGKLIKCNSTVLYTTVLYSTVLYVALPDGQVAAG
jgi:hypothetical protein